MIAFYFYNINISLIKLSSLGFWGFGVLGFCAICHPLFVSFATPFFRSFATRTFATPKNLSLILEGVVDKELAKLVEKVNEELVMDVVVEGVVDNR